MIDKNYLGAWGENYASQIYLKQGFSVLLKNSFNRVGKQLGEIDIIVKRGNLLVFVEVKTRISGKFGLPEESVSFAKQQKILRSVNWFLYQFPEYQTWRLRIDVCAILLNQVVQLGTSFNLDKSVKYSKIITNAVEL
jgi:putative endonuclease